MKPAVLISNKSAPRVKEEMADRIEDVHFLRGLVARLRALAITEPNIADQLRKMADEADNCADALETSRHRP